MKTKKIIYVLTAIGISFLLILNSCGNEINEEDITQCEWKVQSVLIGNKHLDPIRQDSRYSEGNIFVLKFPNDSLLEIQMSVNDFVLGYRIASNEHILMDKTYGQTKKCCDTDFDITFMNALTKITSYSCSGKKLIFRGDKIEIKFVKRENGK